MKKLIILILLLTGQNLYSQSFLTNINEKKYYTTANDKDNPQIETSFKLTHPKGGEKILVGSDTLITWEGIHATEPVKLEFSNDNSLTWRTITDSATGLKYNWSNIPGPPSDECIVRITPLNSNISNVNAPAIEWEKCFGGSNHARANSIQQSLDGGYIVAGWTESNDGDVSEYKGGKDYGIVKFSPNGDIEWKKSYGGSEDDEANSIYTTTDGGYIVAGYSRSYDGDVSGYESDNCWILKLNSIGELEWERSYGDRVSNMGVSIQQTNDGGYIVAGNSSTSNGVIENHGSINFWVLKLGSFGEFEWEKSYGGMEKDIATSIQQTVDGGYIVAGQTESSNGDVSGITDGIDFWILKLNPYGELEWEKNYGISKFDYASSIQQTNDGGYIVAGTTWLSDEVAGKYRSNYDYWILKLRADGELEWEKSYGGMGGEEPSSIIQSIDGCYIVAGGTGSTDGDVSEQKGFGDFWIFKLSPDGDIKWEKSYGGSDFEDAKSIQQTKDGGYIIAGYTYSIDGDISRNKGYTNYWIVKLYPDEESVIQSYSSGLFSIVAALSVEMVSNNLSVTVGINSIAPNPADNNINISVTFAEKGQTSIAIYNIEGEKVSEIYAGEVSTFGTYEFTSDISNLSNGTYYVIFQTPTVKDSKSIMIVR